MRWIVLRCDHECRMMASQKASFNDNSFWALPNEFTGIYIMWKNLGGMQMRLDLKDVKWKGSWWEYDVVVPSSKVNGESECLEFPWVFITFTVVDILLLVDMTSFDLKNFIIIIKLLYEFILDSINDFN